MHHHGDAASDSGIDTDMDSDYTSIASSNYQFREEAGRRFHGFDAPYLLPNDKEEEVRLQDLQNYHKAFFGRNIIAPIHPKPTLIERVIVVDVGTGSGLWCVEVAQEFPGAKVVGTDLSPIQPTDIPDNCEFIMESLLDGLSFDTGSVDYLQARSLTAGIPEYSWPAFIAEVYRVLKPGTGRAVLLEPDIHFKSETNTIPEDSCMRKWQGILGDFLGRAKNISIDAHRFLPEMIRARPFVDIDIQFLNIPNGTWPEDERLKHVGKLSTYVFGKGVETTEPILIHAFPEWSDQERREFMRKVKEDIENPEYHAYTEWICVTVRKPEAEIQVEKPKVVEEFKKEPFHTF